MMTMKRKRYTSPSITVVPLRCSCCFMEQSLTVTKAGASAPPNSQEEFNVGW